MANLVVHQTIVGNDNYAVLLHDPQTGLTASIDAPDEAVITRELTARGWNLTHILMTHHHGDHTAGNLGLKRTYRCEIVGPAAEADKIPGIDRTVRGGDSVVLGRTVFEVIETPGHTLGHVTYHAPTEAIAFAGDTLFAMGCGRLLEGDPQMMWVSLNKIAALPPETRIYCGHNYTAANARFALTIEPGNAALQARAARAAAGEALVPMRLADEVATNPFLRANDAAVRAGVGLVDAPAWQVFAEVRARKNRS
jgi:hydroxyacylglutathione hydrolase